MEWIPKIYFIRKDFWTESRMGFKKSDGSQDEKRQKEEACNSTAADKETACRKED